MTTPHSPLTRERRALVGGYGLLHLLLQLIAEFAVAADEAEVGEERRGGHEQAGKQKQAAAAVRKASHLAKADGDEKCGERGEDSQRREGIAVNRGGAQHQRGGTACGQEREKGCDENAGLFWRPRAALRTRRRRRERRHIGIVTSAR